MSRKIPPFTFHVVGVSCNKSWPGGQPHSWNIFCGVIAQLQKSKSLNTHAVVLMSNHYHWICSYEPPCTEEIFEEFHERVRVEYLNHSFFGNSIFESSPAAFPITSPVSLQSTLKYIYRNPVDAGLVFKAEDYSYSTLSFLLGKKKLPFECKDSFKIIFDPIRILSWINDPTSRPLYYKINYYESNIRGGPIESQPSTSP
ncbi:MAG: transposase [Pseudobdellovibrionaceae bacterium]